MNDRECAKTSIKGRFDGLSQAIVKAALVAAIALAVSAQAQTSHLDSLRKAYVAQKMGMFLHFNMATFDHCCCNCLSAVAEWGSPTSSPNLFNPRKLNCGQWADVAKSAGMKYVILVVKHHDGFCLWPSHAVLASGKQMQHSVMQDTVWQGGKGDVCKAFVDSCRSRGLAVGFYYSVRDWYFGCSPNCTGYLQYMKTQVTELLSNYGPLVCLWTDGWGWDVGYTNVPYDTIHNLVQKLQPNCLLVENNHRYSLSNTDIMEYEVPVDNEPPIGNTIACEGCNCICNKYQTWFWHSYNNCDCSILSASSIVSDLNTYAQRNATYLLDLTPDTNGLIPSCQAAAMAQVGQLRGIVHVKNWQKRGSASETVVSQIPGAVVVKIAGSGAASAVLFDFSGNEVRRSTCRSPELAVNTRALAKGMYLLRVRNGTKTLSQRVMISADHE